MGSADYCVFTGYDYALYSRDCTYSKFYDNNVAICVDHAVAESNGVMSWSWFENNGVAIEFKNVLSSRAMSTFTIVENCFISNTKDIQDDVQRNIFVPGCYFADRENGVLTVRECRTDEHVMYYPQAANTEFTEFIYDTDWYNVDKIVICANFTATFPIPEEYLDGNFTIMNADGSANLGTWQFNQRGGRQ